MDQQKTSRLAVVILAAGKGTRMKSELAKVLHPLAGRPLVEYPLELAQELKADLVILVVGHQAARVRQVVGKRPNLRYALQEPQLGTGHAVMAAAGQLSGFDGEVLILSGDVPGLRPATARALLARHRAEKNAMTVLAMEPAEPGAYGRLISGPDGLRRIVEFRDANPSERAVRLVNAGIYVVGSRELWSGLQHLDSENDQQEYYLTDLVEVLAGQGLKVGYEVCADAHEVSGVNSLQELADWERRLCGYAAKKC